MQYRFTMNDILIKLNQTNMSVEEQDYENNNGVEYYDNK